VLACVGKIESFKLKAQERRIAVFPFLHVDIDHEKRLVVAEFAGVDADVIVGGRGPVRGDLGSIARRPFLKLDGRNLLPSDNGEYPKAERRERKRVF